MTLTELEGLVPLSSGYKLNPAAKYVFLVENMSADRALEIQNWLQNEGINCVVLPVECRIFEIQ